MEGAVIGCVPYVKPVTSSSILECYEDTSFVTSPEGKALTSFSKCLDESKMLNSSSPDTKLDEGLSSELLPCSDDDKRVRLTIKFGGSSKRVETQKPTTVKNLITNMRLVEEKKIKSDVPSGRNSTQIDTKISRVSPNPNASLTPSHQRLLIFEKNTPGESQDPSTNLDLSKEAANDISKSVNGDCAATNLVWDAVAAHASNTNSSSTGNGTGSCSPPPDSPESNQDASESAKKRYLYDFRPDTHLITVKTKNGEKSFRCYVCGGIYQQKFSLKRHYLRNHVDFRYISENDISNCNIPIPNYFKKLHSSADFKKSTNGRKKFKKGSNDIFLENNDNCLMPGLYRCHDCPNIFFNTEPELKAHYNMHPEAVKKKFQCEVCGASFFKKQILSRHLASHGKKKVKFECKRCTLDFDTQVELVRHANSHSGGKLCKYCGKSLSTTANRKRHEALHLGLKPYGCIHCGMSFAQSKDLDRHLRKHHNELCHECPECFKLFASAENLESHVREKHGEFSPKKLETSNSGSSPEKDISKAPVVPPAVIHAKKVTCRVCRRIFRSMYAMLKHKRQAHAYQSRKRRRGVRPKVGAGHIGFRKSPATPQQSTESPAKRGRPRSPRVVEKYLRQNTRPGPRISSRREEELYREYYLNVAEQINRNILHHIDGRASQLSLKEYNFNDRHYPSGFFEDRTRLPWSHYNFPQWYDVDNALKTKGQEIKRPENLSSQDEFLYDATGLAPARCNANSESQGKKLDDVKEENVRPESRGDSLNRSQKIFGKEAISLILCGVCKETFNSPQEHYQHIVNNHPNVSCHYMIFEGDKESPPVIPLEMRQTYLSPVGFRFSCDVPPSQSEGSMKCTKCKSEFPTRTELHIHLTVCGNLVDSSHTRVWRKKTRQRRIKNTMKHRMDLNPEEHVVLNADDYKTPEKLNLDCVDNLGGKVSKLSDKPQLFKNGRLQTKSLSVDMNYFKTKPLKPSKGGVSKRGRKSYAFVSSMYRNATLQPSSSRECNECRILFPSLSALNMHLKSHSESQTEENSRTPPPAFISENVSIQSRPPHPPKVNKLTSVRSQISTSSLKNTPVNLFASPVNKHQTNTFSPSPKSVVCSGIETKKSTSAPSQFKKDDGLQAVKSTDSPMDLSTNSCEKKVPPPSTNNTLKKTALEIAMDAIMKYSEKDKLADRKSGNEHISRLQETVEKLTVPTVSPILKPTVVKKVGRPRKLKKILPNSSTTLQGSSKSVFLKNDASKNSKPVSKLEATVERLKNKVSSQEKRSPSLNVSEPANKESSVTQIDHSLKNSNVKELVQPTTQASLTQEGEKSKNAASSNTCESASLSADREEVGTSLDLSNSDLNNQVPDPVIVEDKAENHTAVSASEKIPADVLNKTPESVKNIQKITFEDKRIDQGLPVLSSTEFPLLGNTEKISPSSQGRCSPTFDSILKVINQKLHSEEASQHDDTAISWLEDEKFEIPPPRSNLNIVVTSNASTELTPVKSSSSLLADINVPEKDVLKSDVLQTGINIVSENASTSSTDLLNGEALKNAGQPDSNPAEHDKEKSDPGCCDIQTPSEENADATKGASQIPQRIISVDCPNNLESIEAKSPEKSTDLLPLKSLDLSTDISKEMLPSKDVTNLSENVMPARKRPGRPRKNKLEDPDVKEVSNKKRGIRFFNRRKENTPSVSSEIISDIPMEKNIVLSDTTKNESDISNKIVTDDNNVQRDADAMQTTPNLSDEKSPARKNKSRLSLLSNKPKRGVSKRMELSVRGRKKTKKIEEMDSQQNMLPKDTISTEFAKNLASKIKEGLSNDINTSKGIVKAEVKKEFEYVEPSKKHSCPYCMLEFAYLTNFRRHLKVCVARTEKDTQEPVPEKPTGNLLHLPKKDEVDYSMLNLYRHQSRQTQMLKDVEKSVVPGTPIKKYECAVCHRIYLNLFTFLQHKIVHNLTPQNSNESVGLNDSSGFKNDGNDIGNSYLNESTPESVHLTNQSDLIDKNNSSTPSQIPEESVYEPPKQMSSIVTEAVKQIKNKLKRDNIPTNDLENTEIAPEPNKSEDFVIDSTESENTKVEALPVKKKRGRPFGWRKNANVTEDNNKVVKQKNSQASRKNSSLIYKKAGKLNSIGNKSLVSSKFIAKTKKVILNKIGKTVKLPKPIIAHDSPKLETNSDVTDAKPQKLDTPPPENLVKDVVKESVLAYSFPSDDDFVDVKQVKRYKSLKLSSKSTKNDVQSMKIQPIKRPRGRPPVVHSTVPETPSDPLKTSVILPNAAETPTKRRPGRPPKQLQSTAGPSQPSKSGSSSSHIRSGRRSAPIPNIDSSDSDCDIMKPNSPPKKKVSKNCSVCKRKFLSTLALHRHIQIMHNRRIIQNPEDTSDLPVKIPKKISPKLPTVDAMETDLSPKIPKKMSTKLFAGETESNLLPKIPKKTSPKLSYVDTMESDLPTKIFKKPSPKQSPVHSIESDIPLKMLKKSSPKLSLADGTDPDLSLKISKKTALKSSSVDAIESNLPLKTLKKTTLKSSSVDATELDLPLKISRKTSVKSSVDAADFDLPSKIPKKTALKSPSVDATELNLPAKIPKKTSKPSSVDPTELDLPAKIPKKTVLKSSSVDATELPPKMPKKTTLKSSPVDVAESDLTLKITKKSSKSSLADAIETDLPPKILKRKSPKPFPVNTPESDNVTVEKGRLKICAICKSKFVTSALLRDHIQTFHSRKSEPMPLNMEIPAENSNVINRSLSVKTKQPGSPNRNSLSRQCRKSLPIIQKRFKKQPSEQIKKQKL